VLVMDEPTNDLDMETLELLESLLVDFKGTVLLVSHDRSFVDSVASSCLLFEGNGNISEHIGGYSEVAAYQARRAVVAPEKPKGEKKATAAPAKKAARKKLSYKDQRELDNLPDKIDDLESQLQQLSDQSASAEFYQQDAQKVNDTLARLAALQEELDSCMERWMELSEAAGD
jgi:ATP-binding cassette subfamily F protein uup